jgi:hypothetical protein
VVKPANAIPDEIEAYLDLQSAEHGEICRHLVAEIRRCLPGATSRLYHGSPAWFIGENAVVGVSVKARAGVTLLFWNGQAFKSEALIPVGRFKAAERSFQTVGEVSAKLLRPLLRKAGEEIWDLAGSRRKRRA